MIKIAVVEDEQEYQKTLKEYLRRFEGECGQILQPTFFSDGLDIVEEYEPVWDIILMDIRMKHLDGMKAAERIRSCDSAVLIIFITTMAQYAIQGYEVDALDFVLKPITYSQFSLKMQKALVMLKKTKHTEEKYLMLPDGERKKRVSVNDILYIEVINHDLHIVTNAGVYVMRYSMQKMEKELEAFHFVRCSNSYLVNLKNVTGTGKETVLTGAYELPVSRPKKKQFLKALSDYLGAGYR